MLGILLRRGRFVSRGRSGDFVEEGFLGSGRCGDEVLPGVADALDQEEVRGWEVQENFLEECLGIQDRHYDG